MSWLLLQGSESTQFDSNHVCKSGIGAALERFFHQINTHRVLGTHALGTWMSGWSPSLTLQQ